LTTGDRGETVSPAPGKRVLGEEQADVPKDSVRVRNDKCSDHCYRNSGGVRRRPGIRYTDDYANPPTNNEGEEFDQQKRSVCRLNRGARGAVCEG
jgi:hypothetical protein